VSQGNTPLPQSQKVNTCGKEFNPQPSVNQKYNSTNPVKNPFFDANQSPERPCNGYSMRFIKNIESSVKENMSPKEGRLCAAVLVEEAPLKIINVSNSI
jgi:hypothetical protein